MKNSALVQEQVIYFTIRLVVLLSLLASIT